MPYEWRTAIAIRLELQETESFSGRSIPFTESDGLGELIYLEVSARRRLACPCCYARERPAELTRAADDRRQWPTAERSHVGYLTLVQAAHYLGVSTATIRRWIASSSLPHYHIPGAGGQRGKLLFRQGEIDRWMRRFRNGLASFQGEDGAQREGAGDEFGVESLDRRP